MTNTQIVLASVGVLFGAGLLAAVAKGVSVSVEITVNVNVTNDWKDNFSGNFGPKPLLPLTPAPA